MSKRDKLANFLIHFGRDGFTTIQELEQGFRLVHEALEELRDDIKPGAIGYRVITHYAPADVRIEGSAISPRELRWAAHVHERERWKKRLTDWAGAYFYDERKGWFA